MRASPAFRICVRHHGVWRGAVASLLLATLAVQAAWLAARIDDLPAAAVLAAAGADAALLAMAAATWRTPAVELRWDTRHWHLAPADAPASAARPGRLAVALDLGNWMLLRFEPLAPGVMRRGTWVPVQRRGHEPHWHALRCAVYCARPGADGGAMVGAGPESQE